MMKKLRITDIILLILLAVGFIGALKVSYENITGQACPHFFLIPICYVVLIAYGLMIVSTLSSAVISKHYLFWAGWVTATLIAMAGSISELMAGGGVCPTSGSGAFGAIPLCYVSLAMLIVILILFLMGPYKRASHVRKAH